MATLQGTETEDGEEILSNGGPGQRTLCLIGNASEYSSHTRRTNILEAINPSWSSCAAEKFAGAKDSIFGEAFQADLTERVQKDTALAKAVSITKKQKKECNHFFTPRSNPRDVRFFVVVGGLLPSTQASRAGMPLHATSIITQTGQKQTRGGFSSIPKGPRDPRASSTNQDSPQA